MEANLFNQVALCRVRILGTVHVPFRAPFWDGNDLRLEQELPTSHRNIRTSMDGDRVLKHATVESENECTSNGPSPITCKILLLGLHLGEHLFDSNTRERIHILEEEKKRAVLEENYRVAKLCKERLTLLQRLVKNIAQIDHRKQRAVELEDYDAAINFKAIAELERGIITKVLDQAVSDDVSSIIQDSSMLTKGQEPVPTAPAVNKTSFSSASNSTPQQHTTGKERSDSTFTEPQPHTTHTANAAKTILNIDDLPAVAGMQAGSKASLPFPIDETEGSTPVVLVQHNHTDGHTDVVGNHSEARGASNHHAKKQNHPTSISPDTSAIQEHPKASEAEKTDNPQVEWDQTLRGALLDTTPANAPALEPLSVEHQREFVDIHQRLGTSLTEALVSRSFHHREAAVRVLANPNNTAATLLPGGPTAIAEAILLYGAHKGFGLTDPIVTVFLSYGSVLKDILFYSSDGGKKTSKKSIGALLLNDDALGQRDDEMFRSRARLWATVSLPVILIQPLIPLLLFTRSADGNVKCREVCRVVLALCATHIGLERMAQIVLQPVSSSGGPNGIADLDNKSTAGGGAGGSSAGAASSKNKKQALNFRLFVARLQLLLFLLQKAHVAGSPRPPGAKSILGVDSFMTKLVLESLQHANAEVREQAVQVLLFCYTLPGYPQALSPYLQKLKPAQRTSIEERCAKAAEEAEKEQTMAQEEENPPRSAKAAPRIHEGEMLSRSLTVTQGQELADALRKSRLGTTNPDEGGGSDFVPPVPRQETKHAASNPGLGNIEAPPVCPFCGMEDARLGNERTMDLHFVYSCPYLCPCPRCAQVVEIPVLHEHQKTECEHRNSFRLCETCHETFAYPTSFMEHALQCFDRTPTDEGIKDVSDAKPRLICPLCKCNIIGRTGEREPERVDIDLTWKRHLLDFPGCSKNPRALGNQQGMEFSIS